MLQNNFVKKKNGWRKIDRGLTCTKQDRQEFGACLALLSAQQYQVNGELEGNAVWIAP